MTETPISNADETENPDTAHSKAFAETTPPADLRAALETLSDFQLVEVALVANAVLYKRATNEDE